MGRLLAGKTVGIIGFGAIGQRVGELCNAFGAKTICSDVCTLNSPCAEQFPLKKMLGQADIVSIHSSGCDCVLDEDSLDSCKHGAIICNTARGGQIDEHALAARLADGRIGYACLDVFDQEPYAGPLAQMKNTILTPHIGSYASEARIDMELLAVDNLLHALGAI